MRLLAVDTATKTCSVAVVDDQSVISEYTVNHKDTHSRFLMGMIDSVFNICRMSLKDIDGFAVTIGPGSFTGLRIGLSAVKGLALASGKPVVGISSLEALAYPFRGSDKLICPMLDARRNEVYTACYRFNGPKMENRQLPAALSPDKAAETITEPCIVVGDGAMLYQDLITDALGSMAFFANTTQHVIRAANVAHIAMQRFQGNNPDDAGVLEPFYIRKSDAEKTLKTAHPG